jgi:hypothetical protein
VRPRNSSAATVVQQLVMCRHDSCIIILHKLCIIVLHKLCIIVLHKLCIIFLLKLCIIFLHRLCIMLLHDETLSESARDRSGLVHSHPQNYEVRA